MDCLKVVEFEEGKEEVECAVCTEVIKEGAKVYKLPCKHVFHKECIDKWLEEHKNCPNCRADLTKGLQDKSGKPLSANQSRASRPIARSRPQPVRPPTLPVQPVIDNVDPEYH